MSGQVAKTAEMLREMAGLLRTKLLFIVWNWTTDI